MIIIPSIFLSNQSFSILYSLNSNMQLFCLGILNARITGMYTSLYQKHDYIISSCSWVEIWFKIQNAAVLHSILI